MTARQIADSVVSLADSYRKLGPGNVEAPSAYARRRLTEKKAGESRKAQYSADVVDFIGLLLDGFIRQFDVSHALFEGYCAGMRRNHEDRTGMAFMAYLCLFRYNPIDFDAAAIGPLIFHVSARTRIVEFINFMCDASALAEHASPFWCRHVQDAYVEDFLIPTSVENATALRKTILTATERGETFVNDGRSCGKSTAGGGVQSTASLELADEEDDSMRDNGDDEYDDSSPLTTKRRSVTVTSSPKFSTPRPPRNQLPPAGVRDMKHTLPEKRPKAVITDKATDAELRVVEAAKHGKKLSALDDETRAANRLKEEAIPFKPFSANSRPSNMDRLLEEKWQRERDEMAGQPPRPSVEEVRRNLTTINDRVEVKTTKAALKRELALVQKKREEEEAKFGQRLAALRDDTEFREWQAQGRQEDDAERLRQMQQRKLDAMLTDEEARMARLKQAKLRQAESRAMKEEIGEQREVLKRENEQKQSELARNAVEQRQQLVADVAVAVDAVQKTKRNAFEEVKKERQKNEVEMALQAELERRRKAEMIQKIKQMQKESAELRREAILARQQASKMVNYTSTTDDGAALKHAAMDEMSLVDLKKLLAAVQTEQARLTEEKRQRINAEREAERQSVQQMEAVVLRHREQVRNEKEEKRVEKRQQLSVVAAANKAKEEQQIQELQAKLAKRREERLQTQLAVKDDERKRVVAAQLLMKDSKAVEKKKLEQMERAAENTVIAAQNARLRERRVQRAISANEAGRREDNLNSAQRKLQTARALSDQINEGKKVLQKQEDIHDELVRKALYAEMGMTSSAKKW